MRVLVVDGDERVRRRLGRWVCAEDADVALVDVHLAAYGGASWPRHLPFALTTSPFDDVSQRFADSLGALGVIAKDAPDLHGVARRLAEGVQVHVPSSHPAPIRFSPLDREILRLAAEGLTNAEIGARVHLSRDTVKQHTRALYARLGVPGRAGAVNLARRLQAIPGQPAARISPREHDVLRVLATGATNAEIARRLGLSPHTVKQHTCSIYRKLGARNRAQAAVRIPRTGIPRDAPPSRA
jgi:DNA-binding CsgD family transcriptional regulator